MDISTELERFDLIGRNTCSLAVLNLTSCALPKIAFSRIIQTKIAKPFRAFSYVLKIRSLIISKYDKFLFPTSKMDSKNCFGIQL